MEIKKIVVGSLVTNCYLFISRGEAVVIDPGSDAQLILKEIKDASLKVNFIVNTHYHFDHIDANKEIKKETGAKILIHEAEKPYLDFEADKYLVDGDVVKVGGVNLRVVHTPGHSAGSICLLGKDFIFTGDTIFMDGQGRTDLPGGSEDNMENSLEILFWIIKPDMTIYPGHGEVFKS